MAQSLRLRLREVVLTAFALIPAGLIIALLVVPLAYWSSSIWGRDSTLISPASVFWAVFPRTALLSGGAAFIAVLFGGTVAFLYAFSNPRPQRWIAVLMTIPLLVGYLARNYAWLGLLSFSASDAAPGFVRPIAASLIYSQSGVILVIATVFVPFAFFVMLQGFGTLSPELFASSRTLGCSDWKSLQVIVLPLVARQTLLAFGLCSVLSLSYFVTPRMIGGGNHDFVGNEVLRIMATPGDVISASWVALYMFVATILPILLLVWYAAQLRKTLIGH